MGLLSLLLKVLCFVNGGYWYRNSSCYFTTSYDDWGILIMSHQMAIKLLVVAQNNLMSEFDVEGWDIAVHVRRWRLISATEGPTLDEYQGRAPRTLFMDTSGNFLTNGNPPCCLTFLISDAHLLGSCKILTTVHLCPQKEDFQGRRQTIFIQFSNKPRTYCSFY